MKIGYDIRGEVEKDFNKEFIEKMVETLPSSFILGYDNTPQSKIIYEWIKEVGIEKGKEILDLEVSTTPLTAFASYYLNKLSIMITASHLGERYTGFKINEKGKSWEKEKYIELLEKIKLKKLNNRNIQYPNSNTSKKGILKKIFEDVFEKYKENWLKVNDNLKKEKLQKIEVNIKKENCVFKILNLIFKKVEIDPTSSISFDTDGDRFYLFKDSKKLFPDLIGIVFAKYLTKKGDNIIFNVGCSILVYEELKDRDLEMVKTGRNIMAKAMEGASFGFEYSGHYYFSDGNYELDDGIKALIEFLKIGKEKFMKEYNNLLQKTNISDEYRVMGSLKEYHSLVEKFKKNAYRIISLDGYRLEFGNEEEKKGFLLIRQSNTEEKVSIRFEHKEKEFFNKLKKEVEETIKNNQR